MDYQNKAPVGIGQAFIRSYLEIYSALLFYSLPIMSCIFQVERRNLLQLMAQTQTVYAKAPSQPILDSSIRRVGFYATWVYFVLVCLQFGSGLTEKKTLLTLISSMSVGKKGFAVGGTSLERKDFLKKKNRFYSSPSDAFESFELALQNRDKRELLSVMSTHSLALLRKEVLDAVEKNTDFIPKNEDAERKFLRVEEDKPNSAFIYYNLVNPTTKDQKLKALHFIKESRQWRLDFFYNPQLLEQRVQKELKSLQPGNIPGR